MTAVASVADLATYLDLPDLDVDRAQLLLNLAQAKCEAVITPLPASALGVVLDVAARAYTNPTNADSQSTGPFAVTYRTVSGGLWLTRNNLAELRRLTRSGAFTIDMTPVDAGPANSWPPVTDVILDNFNDFDYYP